MQRKIVALPTTILANKLSLTLTSNNFVKKYSNVRLYYFVEVMKHDLDFATLVLVFG